MLTSDYIPMRQGKPVTLLAWVTNERDEPELLAIDSFRVFEQRSFGIQRDDSAPLMLETPVLADLQRGIEFFVEHAKSMQAELNLIKGEGLNVVADLGRVLNEAHRTTFTPGQTAAVLKMIAVPADRLTAPKRPRGPIDQAIKRALKL